MSPTFYRLFLFALVLVPCLLIADDDADAQRAKDARIVKVLLRLQDVNLNEKPEQKAAVLRYLTTIPGTEKYFELIDRFGLKETRDDLLKQAIENSDTTAGVESARMLLKFDERDLLAKTISGGDDAKAAKLLQAIGLIGDAKNNDFILPLMTDEKLSRTVRTAATSAVGRNVPGQKALLALVEQKKLPADLNFAAGNVLFGSADPAIRAAAAKHIVLPATANAEPIPPIADLVKREGDAIKGQKIYATTGTCAKCHKVRGEGKDVGPDLSEIGSKLSKEAFFVSILDPSAGISHNFETYSLVTDDGNVIIGLLVSDTAEAITLKTAEAIVRTIPKSQVEEFKKQTISLMPADLQKLMTVQDLVDVVAYLGTLKKM
jgi:putative heme-binding domain-containing protein